MKDRIGTQAPEAGVGPPPEWRSSDVMHVEIAKIQSDAEYLKRDLGETRGDMKDIRDRMARLETHVDHLPSKGFIVSVVSVGVVILGGLVTLGPKIQDLLGIVH